MTNRMIFEVAAEVCYQIGGIYRVIHSKIPYVLSHVGRDNYCLIGPYLPVDYSNTFREFEHIDNYNSPVGKVVKQLQSEGIDIHFGEWIVSGAENPQVVLINPYQTPGDMERIKKEFQSSYGVPVPPSSRSVDMFLTFGQIVYRFFECIGPFLKDKQVVAHFHECHTAFGLLEIHRKNLGVKTIFTTHSTILGRSIASKKERFFENLGSIDVNSELEKLPPAPRFSAALEVLAAKFCTIFTTVSNLTANECQYILGRKVDLVTPNGLNEKDFAQALKTDGAASRSELDRFVSQWLKLNSAEACTIIFTSGRYEYQNKGFDVLVHALGKLNRRLREQKYNGKVVAIFVTNELYIPLPPWRIFLDDVYFTLWRVFNRIRVPYFPFKVPRFYLLSEIAIDLRRSRLFNRQSDHVHVVLHPKFISRSSETIKLDYFSFVRSCDIGVFASEYEPWGYTAAECMSLGTPAVVSSVSGLAHDIDQITPSAGNVMHLLNRGVSKTQAAEELCIKLEKMLREKKSDFITNELALSLDWSKMFTFYAKAYDLLTEEIEHRESAVQSIAH